MLNLLSAPLPADNNKTTDLLNSDANLTLLDSVSTIPFTDLANSSDFYQLLFAFYTSSFDQFFVNDLLLTSYSYKPFFPLSVFSGEPFPNSFFPTLFIHNTSTGKLVQTAVLNFNNNPPPNIQNPSAPPYQANSLGVLDTAISPTSTAPYIAVSAFAPVNGVTLPLPPNLNPPFNYTIYMYSYNTNGTLNYTPVDAVDITSFNSNIDTNVITYNSASSFSYDGKYLFVVYTLKSTTSDPSQRTQVFAGIQVNSDGTLNRTPAFQYALPNAPAELSPPAGSTSLYFVEPDVKSFNPKNSSIYKLVATFIGFQAGDETGGNVPGSLLMSFDFNPTVGSISLTGIQNLPGYGNGIDLHPNNTRVIVGCTGSNPNGLGVAQFPRPPFASDIPESNKNLRLYSYDSTLSSNALQYIKGHDMGTTEFYNCRWSHSGDFLAISFGTVGAGYASLPVVIPPSTVTFDPYLAPSSIATLSFNSHRDNFTYADIQPASATQANLAWSSDDSQLATSGCPAPGIPFSTSSGGFKDLQLYQVVTGDDQ